MQLLHPNTTGIDWPKTPWKVCSIAKPIEANPDKGQPSKPKIAEAGTAMTLTTRNLRQKDLHLRNEDKVKYGFRLCYALNAIVASSRAHF
jgi:hypothetical protein